MRLPFWPEGCTKRHERVKVNSWFTLDVATRFAITRNIEVGVGVRNLLNKDYYANYSEGFNTSDNHIKANGRTLNVRFAINY